MKLLDSIKEDMYALTWRQAAPRHIFVKRQIKIWTRMIAKAFFLGVLMALVLLAILLPTIFVFGMI